MTWHQTIAESDRSMTAHLAQIRTTLTTIRDLAMRIRDDVEPAHQRGTVREIEALAAGIMAEVDACLASEAVRLPRPPTP